MRVVFVDPPGWQKGLNVGIAYLASILNKSGKEVRVIDMNNLNLKMRDLREILLGFRPDVIGYSVKTSCVRAVSILSGFTKELFPSTLHIAGGPHITLYPEEFIKDNPQFDALLVGECEGSLDEILRSLREKTSLPNYRVINIEDRKIIYSPFTLNLNSLPTPDFGSFWGLNIKNYHWPLVTSRGCPYNCVYCCAGKINGRRVRMRSPENVVAEIEAVIKNFGIRKFEVLDDCFNIDIERVKNICSLILKKKIVLEWSCPNGIRADKVDRELVGVMAKSGCKMVMLGIETADKNVFRKIGKHETLEDVIRAIKLFKNVDIKVGGFFIIGLPGSSKKSIDKSIEFVRHHGLDFAHFNLLIPYPGTEVWQWIEKNGRFIRDYKNGMHFGENPKPIFETDKFTQDEMIECFLKANITAGNFNWFLPERLSLWERRKKILFLCWRYDKKKIIKWIYILLKNKCAILKTEISKICFTSNKYNSNNENSVHY